ncbi:hypothetical protein [Reyranella sp.]|nr:hypothetical protein [Reyranella sp.]
MGGLATIAARCSSSRAFPPRASVKTPDRSQCGAFQASGGTGR